MLESAGFDIGWHGDLIDLGLVQDHETKLAIEQRTRWDYPDEIVRRACLAAGDRLPDADVVVQAGAGMRPSLQAAAIESAIGKPLVSTDIALFWGILRAANQTARGNSGTLLDSLTKG